MSYNYSIIIPHKNIPDLLERALASIPQRDDTEVIVVDDGSDPGVVDFDKFPGFDRPCTRVVFRDGSDHRRGAGAARNDGLALASGRWISFVDADDLLLPTAAALMDKYADSNADIVFMGSILAYSDTLEPVGRQTRQMEHMAAWLKKGREYGIRYKMYAPWGKFIKRQLIEDHDIRFSETLYAEDMIFSARSGHFARILECDPTPVYCYTRRSGTLSSPDNIRRLETLGVKFDEDVKVAHFLKSEAAGVRIPSGMLRTWMAISRLDSRRASELLPTVEEYYPAARVAGARLVLAFGRLAKLFNRKKS